MRFFLLMLPLYFLINSSQKNCYQTGSKILEIHFQDFFEQDTLDITIDSCYALNGVILNSNKITGTTGIVIIISKEDEHYVIEYLSDKKECKIAPNRVEIVIVLNRKLYKYKIDSAMGKYVGFSKKDQGLHFRQQGKRFLYD